jgi:hypothetical protein
MFELLVSTTVLSRGDRVGGARVLLDDKQQQGQLVWYEGSLYMANIWTIYVVGGFRVQCEAQLLR